MFLLNKIILVTLISFNVIISGNELLYEQQITSMTINFFSELRVAVFEDSSIVLLSSDTSEKLVKNSNGQFVPQPFLEEFSLLGDHSSSELLFLQDDSYCISGLNMPSGKISILAQFFSDGRVKSLTNLDSQIHPRFGLSKIKDGCYLVTYQKETKIILLGYNIEENRIYIENILTDLITDSYENHVFKCQYSENYNYFLCMMYEYMEGTSLRLFLLDENLSARTTEIAPLVLESLKYKISRGRFLLMTERTELILVWSEGELIIHSIELGEEVSEPEEHLYYDNLNSDYSPVIKLNDEFIIVALSRDFLTVNMYNINNKSTFLITQEDNPKEAMYYTIFLSLNSEKLNVLNLKELNSVLSEIYFIKCKNIKKIISSEEDKEQTLDFQDLILNSIDDPEQYVYITFVDLDLANSDFSIKGTEDLESEEFEPVQSNKYYKKVIFKLSTLQPPVLTYFLKGVLDGFNVPSSSYCTMDFTLFCYTTCAKCSYTGSEEDHKCQTCKSGYFKKEGTNNCYLNLKGHFLDKENSVFKPCHSSCASCSKEPSTKNTNCDTCQEGLFDIGLFSGLSKYRGNCTNFCDISINSSWYINDNLFFCRSPSEGCPLTAPFRSIETGECQQYFIQEKNSFNVNVLNLENPKDILNLHIIDLKRSLDYNGDYSTPYFSLYFKAKDDSSAKHSKIELPNCESRLRVEHSIEEDSELMTLIIDIRRNQVNQLEYLIFDETGKNLDLSVCSDEMIQINSSINDVSELHIDSYEEIDDDSINLFNAKDLFFNDFCFSYSTPGGADVTIKDRRIFYFQNISIEDSCNIVEFETKSLRLIYSCHLKKDLYFSQRPLNTLNNQFEAAYKESIFKYYACFNEILTEKTFSNVAAYFLSISLLIQLSLSIAYFSINKKHPENLPQKKKRITYQKLKSKLSTGQPKDALEFQNSEGAQSSSSHILVTSKLKKEVKKRSPEDTFSDCTKDEPIKEEKTHLIKQDKTAGTIFMRIKVKKNSFLFFHILKTKHPIYRILFLKIPNFIRCIEIIYFFFNFSMFLSLNSFVYSENCVSYNYIHGGKYHWKKEIVNILESFLGGIFVSYFFSNLLYFSQEFRFRNNIKKDTNKYIKAFNARANVVFIIIFVINLLFIYYTVVFLNIFKGTKKNWLINCGVCIVLWNLFPFFSSFIIYLSGNLGLILQNRMLFDISDILR